MKATWPVMVGYFPMAVAFGLLYGKIFLALLSGVVVYAGAAQFLSVKLFQNQTSLVEILSSIFFLNVRHVFYSLHFLRRYNRFPLLPRLYSIFALTDETYAVLVNHGSQDPVEDSRLVWRISFLNQLSWVAGCFLGALLKFQLEVKIKGLDFFLVGLFVVLLVEQLKKDRDGKAFLLALALGIGGLFSGSELWLFWAMALCVVFAFFLFPKRNSNESP